MPELITIKQFYDQKTEWSLIDVRSPAEYSKGHIVGAVNIPLFSNDERARVGKVYVQESKEKAIELGRKIVEPKLKWFIEESEKVSLSSNLFVHCWRGGMRSRSFATHLLENGFSNVKVLEGGYKSYRKHVLQFFESGFKLRVLGGFTGSGKTYILKEIAKTKAQVVDLEGIAHHKGSAFGAIGEQKQPTVEQFENDLYEYMRRLDISKSIWIEDESHNIGYVKIPLPLYKRIRSEIVYFLDIPKEVRAHHLVQEYASFGNSVLSYAINGIAKRMGGQNVKKAHELLLQNNYYDVALLALQYYDKAYQKGLRKREQGKVYHLSLTTMDHAENAQKIINFVKADAKS